MHLVQLVGDLSLWWAPALLLGMVHGPRAARDGDADLVLAVRGGDATAYRALVERYQNRVYTMVFGVVRDREEAKDLTQDVFVKAYRLLDSCRDPEKFRSWLFSMAMNIAIDSMRRRAVRPAPGPVDDVALAAGRGETPASADHDTPGRRYEVGEMYRELLKVLDELPVEQKQILLLRELEGLSYKEIAEVAQVPEGTVMSRLYYARRRLQEVMGRYDG